MYFVAPQQTDGSPPSREPTLPASRPRYFRTLPRTSGRPTTSRGQRHSPLTRSHRRHFVSFHKETIEEAYESRQAWKAPQWQYDAWVSTYTAVAAGELAPVSDAA